MTLANQTTSTIETPTRSLSVSSKFTIDSDSLDIEPRARTSDANVVWALEVFGRAKAALADDFQDIGEFVAGLESDPQLTESFVRARQALANSDIGKERLSTLAQLRLERGLAQAELAKKAQTSQSHIARIEAKSCDPQLTTIVRLAKALNVEVGSLATMLARDVQ